MSECAGKATLEPEKTLETGMTGVPEGTSTQEGQAHKELAARSTITEEAASELKKASKRPIEA